MYSVSHPAREIKEWAEARGEGGIGVLYGLGVGRGGVSVPERAMSFGYCIC